MKKILHNFGTVCIVLLASGCSTVAQLPITYPDQISTLKADKELSTFLMLSDAAGGLSPYASGKKKGTLIVPTDDAYNRRGVEKMLEMLNPKNMTLSINSIKGQVLDGAFSPKDLEKNPTIKTLDGNVVTVSKAYNVWSFNDAKVIRMIRTKDGYVYVVNKAF
jgi:uncharacterized surface protein with fasciclin (FAS1) repeats